MPTPPQRWSAARARVIYGVNHAARRGVRDVARAIRASLRADALPSDPWLDTVVAGRSGNHCADFMARLGQVVHTVTRCPHAVRARLVELAHRVADAMPSRQAAA